MHGPARRDQAEQRKCVLILSLSSLYLDRTEEDKDCMYIVLSIKK
jgi:hypothetical protein